MRRREFITLIGASVAAWPLTVRAQQRMKRIGVLMALPADDPETQARLAAFAQGLQQLGWTVVKTLQIVAPSFGVELRPVDVSDAAQIERAITAFAREYCNRELGGGISSRAGRRAGGSASITRSLQWPLLRCRRRPDFLWARLR
jgi:hypothetical protein